MKALLSLCVLFCTAIQVRAVTATKNLYFTRDSFRLNEENILLLDNSFSKLSPGETVTFRVLIHEDAKNKVAINELNRKRAAEIYGYFLAEGLPPGSLKQVKTPGREAKGFISDEMKSLMIFDLEVTRPPSTVELTYSDKPEFSEGDTEDFKMNDASGKELVTRSGIHLFFPVDCFEFKSGLAAKGEIVLKLKQIEKPGELASSGLLTMADLQPVKTICIMWIRAECQGKELRLMKGKPVKIALPASSGNPSNNICYGVSFASKPQTLSESSPACALKKEGNDLVFYSSHLHWIACGATAFGNEMNKIQVKSNLSGLDIAVRIMLIDDHVVLAACTAKDGGIEFAHVPAGRRALIYAYGVKDGKSYFYSHLITTSNGEKEKLLLTETKESEMIQALHQADKD